MTYFEHKLRLFSKKKEASPCDVILSRKRSEGRLKNYASAVDVRSWSLGEKERRQHLLDLLNQSPKPDKGERYVSIDIIIEELLALHERQVGKLEDMIGELTSILKNAIPHLSDTAMKETQRNLDNFSTTHSKSIVKFKEPLDVKMAFDSETTMHANSTSSLGSTGFLDQTLEEEIKIAPVFSEKEESEEGDRYIEPVNLPVSNGYVPIEEEMMAEFSKEVGGGWNKTPEPFYPTTSEEEVSDVNAESAILQERLRELQEESRADKEKIAALERSLWTANGKIKNLTHEKNALKVKLTHHEKNCGSEEEALSKIYITENHRMREELEGLEQMCWRIKQVLQWVIRERDSYRKRCKKLSYLASEIDDLKCQIQAWRFTELERSRLERVVRHLKRVLQQQDQQLKHLLCRIDVLSQKHRDCRSKSCQDVAKICGGSRKNLLCLPSPSQDLLMVSQECTEPCSKKGQRLSRINALFIQRPKGRSNLMLLN